MNREKQVSSHHSWRLGVKNAVQVVNEALCLFYSCASPSVRKDCWRGCAPHDDGVEERKEGEGRREEGEGEGEGGGREGRYVVMRLVLGLLTTVVSRFVSSSKCARLFNRDLLLISDFIFVKNTFPSLFSSYP